MAFLTIDGAPIPCALGMSEQGSPELVGDEARTFSGRTRRVIRGWIRSWTVTTIPMPLADAQALAFALQSPEPLRCGGDLIGGTVDCYGSLTALRHQKMADGERAVVEFRLVEATASWSSPIPPVPPDGVLFSARRGLPSGSSFSRVSKAWTLLQDGTFAEVATNVLRIVWLDLDGDGVRETPAFRLEPSRTNLLLQSSNVGPDSSPWGGAPNFSSITPAVSIIAGQTAWQHTLAAGRDSVTRSQLAGVFSGGAETAYLIVENVDAERTDVALRDVTAGAFVCFGRLTWATGEASVVLGTGAVRAEKLADVGPNAGPAYLVAVTATGIPGNQRSVWIYPTGAPGTSAARAAIIHHVQLEEQPFHTSPIVTTTAPVTRTADALSVPLPASFARPVPLTIYLRFVERGAAFGQAFEGDIVEIGSLALRPLLQIENANNTGRYRVLYSTAGGDSFSEAPIDVAIGDVVEIAAVLTAAGAARIRIAKNGGAEQAGPLGTARGLGTTMWPVQALRLAPRGQSPLDVLDCALVLDEWTIPQLRDLSI